MDAIAGFRQAALALQQDERYKALEAARRANDENEALQEKINLFNQRRLDLNREIESPARDDARVKALDEEVNALYGEIMETPGMLAYNEAKQGIRGLVNHIHAIVAAAVDGHDPLQVEEPAAGCAHGGCASCAGCG